MRAWPGKSSSFVERNRTSTLNQPADELPVCGACWQAQPLQSHPYSRVRSSPYRSHVELSVPPYSSQTSQFWPKHVASHDPIVTLLG